MQKTALPRCPKATLPLLPDSQSHSCRPGQGAFRRCERCDISPLRQRSMRLDTGWVRPRHGPAAVRFGENRHAAALAARYAAANEHPRTDRFLFRPVVALLVHRVRVDRGAGGAPPPHGAPASNSAQRDVSRRRIEATRHTSPEARVFAAHFERAARYAGAPPKIPATFPISTHDGGARIPVAACREQRPRRRRPTACCAAPPAQAHWRMSSDATTLLPGLDPAREF